MSDSDKKVVVYFNCEENLKSDSYKMSSDKKLSPGSLFRAFMRRAVKSWEEEKRSNKVSQNKT